MIYLLDTNTIIAIINGRNREVIRKLSGHRAETAISSIVAHELYFGAFGSQRLDENLAAIDDLGLVVLPFDTADARRGGQVRAGLKAMGTPIGPYDVLIAGQALARDMIVVTANVREFQRVEGLKIENWIDR